MSSQSSGWSHPPNTLHHTSVIMTEPVTVNKLIAESNSTASTIQQAAKRHQHSTDQWSEGCGTFSTSIVQPGQQVTDVGEDTRAMYKGYLIFCQLHSPA